MKKIANSLTLVLLSSICTTTNGAEVTEMSCRATERGVEHIAKVEFQAGDIVNFFYGSMSKNGNTCELAGNRVNGRSIWADGVNGTKIVTIQLGAEKEVQVTLLRQKTGVSIRVLSLLIDLCGIKGFMAKEVLIPTHGKICKVTN